MNTSNRFGIFLFSSVIIVGVANIFNPIYNIFHNNKIHSNIMMRSKLRSSSSTTEDEGELIIYGSTNYHLGLWKLKCSSNNNSKGNDCELEIINELDEEIILCWVDHQGRLHHYRQINDNSIKDNSVNNHHVEYTFTKDHFICYRVTKSMSDSHTNTQLVPIYVKDIPEGDFILSYTPLEAKIKHTLTISKYKQSKRLFSFLNILSEPSLTIQSNKISVSTHYLSIPTNDEIIDSSIKKYQVCNICGFQIFYEENVFEQVIDFKTTFTEDLSKLIELLPSNACKKLQASTCIYVNMSLTYGTIHNPVIARGCCYHPMKDSDWLRKNGLNVCKEGCVEIFNAEEYLKSRKYWGVGGVLVHEFSHVYHNKYCPGAYDCEEIRHAYSEAMKAKLYHSVSVHGPQGQQGNIKAYACTNCMEFFAELSVAYLWTCDETTEYNKWYPYNRHQLLSYDPQSCKVLGKYWSQFE